jgi:hypothetical protein
VGFEPTILVFEQAKPVSDFYLHKKKKKEICPYNRPCRPIGLLDVEALTFSRQSPHRLR